MFNRYKVTFKTGIRMYGNKQPRHAVNYYQIICNPSISAIGPSKIFPVGQSAAWEQLISVICVQTSE